MSPESMDAFLEGAHIARLATVRPDGRPHVVPVWYLWQDGALYIESSRESQKRKNLEHNRNVAVTIDEFIGGLQYQFVIMEGAVELIDDLEAAREIAARIYVRYVGEAGMKTPEVQAMLHAHIFIIKLVPQKIRTADTTT